MFVLFFHRDWQSPRAFCRLHLRSFPVWHLVLDPLDAAQEQTFLVGLVLLYRMLAALLQPPLSRR